MLRSTDANGLERDRSGTLSTSPPSRQVYLLPESGKQSDRPWLSAQQRTLISYRGQPLAQGRSPVGLAQLPRLCLGVEHVSWENRDCKLAATGSKVYSAHTKQAKKKGGPIA